MAGRDKCYNQGLIFNLAPFSRRQTLVAARITWTLSRLILLVVLEQTMRIKASIQIDAAPDVIWGYLGVPESWDLFHVKARNTKLISPQGGRVGARYEMQMSAGRRTRLSTCEIIEFQTNSLIRLKSTLEDEFGHKGSAVMTYELQDLGLKTEVYERVDIDDRHINIFFRIIIRWIGMFGRPTGETSLMKLKRIIEKDVAELQR